MRNSAKLFFYFLGIIGMLAPVPGFAQNPEKSFRVSANSWVHVKNQNGRITVREKEEGSETVNITVTGTAKSLDGLLKVSPGSGRLMIDVLPSDERVDLELSVPGFARLRLETTAGQITASGKFAYVWAESDTGTIYADTAPSELKYKFLWTASYPRIVSDVETGPIKEKSAGKHVIEGYLAGDGEIPKDEKGAKPSNREIYLRTARGIILFNVEPSQVPNDLLPKKMTKAAQAIIRSGDSILVNAIRRSAPDLFGDYASTLPPHRVQPELTKSETKEPVAAGLRRVTLQVTDINNRAFGGLTRDDFVITERGAEREILELSQSSEPFNLLLLIDVSGSVEHYVDFIRKAARAFVNTVDPADRVSIVLFSDDVQPLSAFTADKNLLSESLDTFDAGGPTALYDAIGYGLTESIRPLKGDRTAIVILSDGDDNRSFLPFEPLVGSLQESGALVYPMYVPSSLIASSGNYAADSALDPLRARFLTGNLSSRAQEEGERLAKVSGGVYYPISRLSELQKAYEDIVVQLRTSYTITYRSEFTEDTGDRASPRLKIRVNRKDAFVKLGPVVSVRDK